jgi:preprotein translocase subunit SecF
MRLFVNTRYNFMRLGRPALVFSALLFIGSLVLIFVKGPNFGIDFVGGVRVDVLTNRSVTLTDLERIRGRVPVELHSIGRAERELLIQQKGMARAETCAAAVVKERRRLGKFKTLAEVAAVTPGLTEKDLATVFAVTAEESAGAKGFSRININQASPENIRERLQQIIVDKTVANLRVVLGEVFGVPAGAAGKTDLNAIDDPAVLEETLAADLSPADAAAVTRNVVRLRNLGAEAKETRLLPTLDAATAGLKLAPATSAALAAKYYAGTFEIRGTENIGPRVSQQLIGLALKALAFALLAMLAYIAIRFKIASGVVAVLSLFHDVIITLGFTVLLGFEFDLTMVAALLTVVGYSINDTVVVYDRIREDTKQGRKETYPALLNRAINENLSRTLITGTGTLIALTILFFLGGESLRGFAFILWVGIIFGTYSSVYVCGALLVEFENFKNRRRKTQVQAKVAKAQVKKVRRRR